MSASLRHLHTKDKAGAVPAGRKCHIIDYQRRERCIHRSGINILIISILESSEITDAVILEPVAAACTRYVTAESVTEKRRKSAQCGNIG